MSAAKRPRLHRYYRKPQAFLTDQQMASVIIRSSFRLVEFLVHHGDAAGPARFCPIMAAMADSSSKPRRRWLRFSLRSLFIVVAVLAVPLGWEVNRVRNQRLALAEIERTRGLYMGSSRFSNPFSGEPLFLNQPNQVDFLWHVLYDVTFVSAGEMTNDSALPALLGLPKLETLDLRYSQITDAGLERLSTKTSLKWVWLDHTKITDVGLVHLERLPNLTAISLGSSGVTENGMARFKIALPDCSVEEEIPRLQVGSVVGF
jgi:Leucine Rich repeat